MKIEAANPSEDHLFLLTKHKKWDEVKIFINTKGFSAGSKRNCMKFRGNFAGNSPLHWACRHGAPKDIIEDLCDLGGKDLLMAKNGSGWTVLHHACRSDCSDNVDVVECLLKNGGDELMMARDERGDTALHHACRHDASAKVDTIRHLLRHGGKDLVVMKNESGKTALYYAISSNNGVSKDVIKGLFDAGGYAEAYGHEPCYALAFALGNEKDVDDFQNPLDFFLNEKPIREGALLRFLDFWYDLDPLADSVTSDSFTSMLIYIHDLKPVDRDKFLQNPFVRAALNQKIVEVPSLLVLFLDLNLQLLTIFVFSVLLTSGEKIPDAATIILSASSIWFAIREISQAISVASFYDYIGEASNWIDVLQLGLSLYFIISKLYNVDQVMLIVSIGTSWLRLIFVSGNLVYSVAIFVSALVPIFRNLFGFLYVMIIIVIAFAHMFFVAGPLQTDSGDIDCEEWMCHLPSSYFQSFAMLLGGDVEFLDDPTGVHSALAMLFGFIIGILLLNIIIALISNVFSHIQQHSEKAFWESRLRFVDEIQSMSNFIFSKRIRKRLSEHRSALPERRILTDKDPRGYHSWRDVCGDFIVWYVDGEDKFADHPFVRRKLFSMHSFFCFIRIAEWKEIIPPSGAFRKVIMGKRQREELTYGESLIAWFASAIFSTASITLIPFILVLGFITCGYCWPTELKQALFFVKVESERNEMDQLKADLEKSHTEEISVLERRMLNMEDKMDQMMILLHSIKNDRASTS